MTRAGGGFVQALIGAQALPCLKGQQQVDGGQAVGPWTEQVDHWLAQTVDELTVPGLQRVGLMAVQLGCTQETGEPPERHRFNRLKLNQQTRSRLLFSRSWGCPARC